MRTASIATAAALLAALTLTACSGGGDDGDGGGSGEADSGKNTSGSVAVCTTADVGIEVGPSSAAPAAGDEGAVPVTVTNSGDAACVLKGIPAVELAAGDTFWKLQPQDGAAEDAELKLEAAGTATFSISYVRGVAGDTAKGAAVDSLKVTLPGNSEVKSFEWPDPEVAIKSEDELDATVGPFLPAGD
ncbi:DUF4232 domain-containing protein [Streptomyces sp. NPDC002643]